MKKLPLIVLCGPTAVGKTRLGVQWAREHQLEFISGDSRQVYKGLDIGTGKDLDEYHEGGDPVSYHLIDIEEVHNVYSLFRYQQDCYEVLNTYAKKNKPCILVGGSGLYIESVISQYHIAQVEEHPEFRKKHMEKDLEELKHMLLSQNSSLYDKTDVSSKKRVVRALEIHTFSEENKKSVNTFPYSIEPKVYYLSPPRNVVYQRIEERVDSRLKQGMIEEVKKLFDQKVPQERLFQLGLEYREISYYLTGQVSYHQMVQTLKQKIRHFAKAQDTYFRGMARRREELFKVTTLSLDSDSHNQASEQIREFLKDRM